MDIMNKLISHCTVLEIELNDHVCIHCEFPQFQLHNYVLFFVNSYRYLGHIIDNSTYDNDDIEREIRNLFTCTN